MLYFLYVHLIKEETTWHMLQPIEDSSDGIS